MVTEMLESTVNCTDAEETRACARDAFGGAFSGIFIFSLARARFISRVNTSRF